jgi:uncharacterized membrane protein YkvA (DUF1232 family)
MPKAPSTRDLALFFLAVLYLLSPLDLIPDRIPVFGLIDDIITLFWLVKKYRQLTGTKDNVKSSTKTSSKAQAQSGPSASGKKQYSSSSANQNAQGSQNSQSSQSDSKKAEAKPQKGYNPYKILGVNQATSREELDKRYKELARKYHPDRVNHLGKEFQELAHEKMVEIQKAYDELRKKSH